MIIRTEAEVRTSKNCSRKTDKWSRGHVKYYLEMGKDAAINSRPEDWKLQIYICDRKSGK